MLTTLSRYMTTENAATASVPPICSSTVFTTRSMTDDAVLSKKSDEPLNASLRNWRQGIVPRTKRSSVRRRRNGTKDSSAPSPMPRVVASAAPAMPQPSGTMKR